MGRRRTVALALVGVITAANTLALAALIASLLSAQEKSGAELLLKGATIWSTNVVTFGLLFWELDRGGPMRRGAPHPPPPDFQFPQDETPTLAEPNWHPRLVDYVYISFTNATAFSPTDAMPMTRRMKVLMMAESAVSAITVLLVAARAVNILGSAGRGRRTKARRGRGRIRASNRGGPCSGRKPNFCLNSPTIAAYPRRSSSEDDDRRWVQSRLPCGIRFGLPDLSPVVVQAVAGSNPVIHPS